MAASFHEHGQWEEEALRRFVTTLKAEVDLVVQAPLLLRPFFSRDNNIFTISRHRDEIQMITRRASTCLRLSKIKYLSLRPYKYGPIQRRCLNNSAPIATPKPSPASPLAAITSDLDQLSPRFDISADSTEIIKSPTDFFERLKVCSLQLKVLWRSRLSTNE